MAWGNLIRNLRSSTRPIVRSSDRRGVRRFEHNVAPMPLNASGARRRGPMPLGAALLWYVFPSVIVGGIAWSNVGEWGAGRIAHSHIESFGIFAISLICLARALTAPTSRWLRWLAAAPILVYFGRALLSLLG